MIEAADISNTAALVIAACGVLQLGLKWGTVLLFYNNWFDLMPPILNVILAFFLCTSGFIGFALGMSIFLPEPYDSEIIWAAAYIVIDVAAYTCLMAYLGVRAWTRFFKRD